MLRFAAILLASPALLLAKDPCTAIGRALYGQTQAAPRAIFLGEVSQDPEDPVSIVNEGSWYGSLEDGNSIFNRNGEYGSDSSEYSPYNPGADFPPRVWRYVESGNAWFLEGIVSVSPGVPDSARIHPDSLRAALLAKRCTEAPKGVVLPDLRLDSIQVKGGTDSLEVSAYVHNRSNTEAMSMVTYKIFVNDTLFSAEGFEFIPRWERVGFVHGFRPEGDTVRIRLVIDDEDVLEEADEGNNIHEATVVKGVLSIKPRRARPAARSWMGLGEPAYSADGKKLRGRSVPVRALRKPSP